MRVADLCGELSRVSHLANFLTFNEIREVYQMMDEFVRPVKDQEKEEKSHF